MGYVSQGHIHINPSDKATPREWREDEALDSDQAKLLQLLGNKMATFKLRIRCQWTADGDFRAMEEEE